MGRVSGTGVLLGRTQRGEDHTGKEGNWEGSKALSKRPTGRRPGTGFGRGDIKEGDKASRPREAFSALKT